jgi:VanZ family protein
MIDYRRSTKTNRYSIYFVLCCFALPVIFGGVIEIVQSAYFPPRTGDWFDWVADIAGILAVWIVWFGRGRIVSRKRVN